VSLPISVHDARYTSDGTRLRTNRAIFNIGECRRVTEFKALQGGYSLRSCAR
jgi:hypothetical protein